MPTAPQQVHTPHVEDLMAACASVGVEFVALAPKASAWAWDGTDYWRVNSHHDVVTAVVVDRDGDELAGRAQRTNAAGSTWMPAAGDVCSDDADDAMITAGETLTPATDPAGHTDDDGEAGDWTVLVRARVWMMRMLRDKRFDRTIVGADLTRILTQSDCDRTLLDAFEEYTHDVPSDIAREVRAVLEWVPGESDPPVLIYRRDVPPDLYDDITAFTQRNRLRL